MIAARQVLAEVLARLRPRCAAAKPTASNPIASACSRIASRISRDPLPHSRESGDPGCRRPAARPGPPAFAGVTGWAALDASRSAAAAVGGDAGVGQEEAGGRLAGLVEHVDRDAAARVPVAGDAQPARPRRLDQAMGDRRACNPRETRRDCGTRRGTASATCSRRSSRRARSRSPDARNRAGR